MCVHPEFPATEGKSFIGELRKNPDNYTYGDDGAGGPGQLASERIFRAMNVHARDIPFKGAARRWSRSSAVTSTSTSVRCRQSCSTRQQEPRSACS
jgi:tripartite-type tricarboxylate transporter receptor subunit TctC